MTSFFTVGGDERKRHKSKQRRPPQFNIGCLLFNLVESVHLEKKGQKAKGYVEQSIKKSGKETENQLGSH